MNYYYAVWWKQNLLFFFCYTFTHVSQIIDTDGEWQNYQVNWFMIEKITLQNDGQTKCHIGEKKCSGDLWNGMIWTHYVSLCGWLWSELILISCFSKSPVWRLTSTQPSKQISSPTNEKCLKLLFLWSFSHSFVFLSVCLSPILTSHELLNCIKQMHAPQMPIFIYLFSSGYFPVRCSSFSVCSMIIFQG